jgi:hypothetical protein
VSIDERARLAAREVQDHFAAAPAPPPPFDARVGAARRRRSVALVLAVAILGAVSVATALLLNDGEGDPVRTGPAPETVTTPPSRSTTTSLAPDTTPSLEPNEANDPQPPSGVVPPRTVRDDRVVFRVTDVSGETYLVEVPASSPGVDQVVAVPSVYVGPARPAPVGDEPGLELGSVLYDQPAATIAPDWAPPGWAPVPGPQRALDGGAVFTQWEQVGPASPQRFPLDLSTIERGGWTLALRGPGQDNAPRVADALVWTRDEDGFHRLSSRDPSLVIGSSPVEPISLQFGPPGGVILTIDVARGCEALENFDFAIGNFGPWSCLGEYRVQVEGDPQADPGVVEDVLANIAVRSG